MTESGEDSIAGEQVRENASRPIRVLAFESSGALVGALTHAMADRCGACFDTRVANTTDELARFLDEGDADVLLLECDADARSRIGFMSALSIVAGSVPVVVLAPEDQTGIFGLKNGADDYLVKGQYDGCVLARVVRNAYERALYRGNTAGKREFTDRQLVAAISHELKNPLTAMTFDAANLLEGAAGAAPDGLKACIRKFADSCEGMALAIDGIIDRIQKERQ